MHGNTLYYTKQKSKNTKKRYKKIQPRDFSSYEDLLRIHIT